VVWRWDPDTFGTAAPSIATISYNLRFPGQYYMAETGLMYNYFRDYDPQTGRYIESDPIGLESGINTYAYVEDNPLWFGDRSGLTIADIILQLFPQQWSSDRCAQIAQKIANLNKDLDDRYELIRTNPGQLPQYGPGPNYTTVQGHYRVINKLDRDRRNLENDYDRHCRNGGCPPASPAADPTSNPAATAGSASTFFFVIGGILIFL
jgi:RHS repeat-associated protein